MSWRKITLGISLCLMLGSCALTDKGMDYDVAANFPFIESETYVAMNELITTIHSFPAYRIKEGTLSVIENENWWELELNASIKVDSPIHGMKTYPFTLTQYLDKETGEILKLKDVLPSTFDYPNSMDEDIDIQNSTDFKLLNGEIIVYLNFDTTSLSNLTGREWFELLNNREHKDKITWQYQ